MPVEAGETPDKADSTGNNIPSGLDRPMRAHLGQPHDHRRGPLTGGTLLLRPTGPTSHRPCILVAVALAFAITEASIMV